MKISYELNLVTFDAWGGAEDTLNRIFREGKADALEQILEAEYPDGMDETELNDLLRFEEEAVFEWLGIKSESQIRDELHDAEDELEELYEEMNNGLDDESLSQEERKDIIESFQSEIEEVKNRINDLKNELENI